MYVIFIYLIINNSLYNFISYAFLGIKSFADDNFKIGIFMVMTILSIFYLIYQYKKEKKIEILYLLFFNFMTFSIFDKYHVVVGCIPTIGYFINKFKLNEKFAILIFSSLVLGMFCFYGLMLFNNNYVFNGESEILKYRLVDKNVVIMKEYLKDNYDDNFFIIDIVAYLYKLESGITINKLDLLNNGNFGKKGYQEIINELNNRCKNNKCTFLMNPLLVTNNVSQYNQEIINYINDNYNVSGGIMGFNVYTNY